MPSPKVPVLNPVLRLLTPKRPAPISGGGKSAKDIISDRLSDNRQYLPQKIDQIKSSVQPRHIHAGKVLLHAAMAEDRLRPTLTPDNLFDERQTGTKLVTSVGDGFIVEATFESLDLLSRQIQVGNTIGAKVDITSLKELQHYSLDQKYTENDIHSLWSGASCFGEGGEKYRGFTAWLLPFYDVRSKKSTANLFKEIVGAFDFPNVDQTREEGCWISSNSSQSPYDKVGNALSDYLNGVSSSVSLQLVTIEQLKTIVSSGTVCRIDPVSAIKTSVAPGDGSEPSPPTPNISQAPIVAVVDGGLSARSYQPAVGWEPNDFFVPTWKADLKHGNQVASLVVNASGWNNNLDIPDSPCRIAPVQVVPKDESYPFSEEYLLEYLDQLMGEHPETKVWNFSFNQVMECQKDCVSFLGDGLHKISRKYGVLPIISAGNKECGQVLLAPPADCESALTIAGRKHDQEGNVTGCCDVSRNGLGPCSSLRPDLSWYSELRVIGGNTVVGTSYATPLVSRVAAYLFANLKDPTPDLVRAMIINSAEKSTHDFQLGWGSPSSEYDLWNCSHNSVTLAWTSTLESGQEYHWHDIAIPPTMLNNDKLKGEIILTAILTPHVEHGSGVGHYFMSRLETNVQVLKSDGKPEGLLDGCKTNGTLDKSAAKWSPIRHSKKEFKSKLCADGKVRLRARIYLRDKYKLKTYVGDGRPGVRAEVAFALTFRCTDQDKERAARTYDEFYNLMRNNVEAATIEVQEQVQLSS